MRPQPPLSAFRVRALSPYPPSHVALLAISGVQRVKRGEKIGARDDAHDLQARGRAHRWDPLSEHSRQGPCWHPRLGQRGGSGNTMII